MEKLRRGAGINGARVGGAVDGEGDGVSLCGITAYGTCDGNGAGGFCGVDDVISGDVVNGDGCSSAGINGVGGSCGGGE